MAVFSMKIHKNSERAVNFDTRGKESVKLFQTQRYNLLWLIYVHLTINKLAKVSPSKQIFNSHFTVSGRFINEV